MPAERELSPEAAKLLDARKAAAAELKAIDGQDRWLTEHCVIRLANARLYEASVVERVLTGESITAAEFKSASDMVEAARAAAPVLCKVEVKIVPSVDTAPPDAAAVSGLLECRRCHWKPDANDRVSKCYRCGWKHGDDTQTSWSASPLAASSQTPSHDAPGASAGPSAPASNNVVKLPTQSAPRHPGSIHDAVLNGVPARQPKIDDSWKRHVATVDSPIRERPNFEQHHVLPMPPRGVCW